MPLSCATLNSKTTSIEFVSPCLLCACECVCVHTCTLAGLPPLHVQPCVALYSFSLMSALWLGCISERLASCHRVTSASEAQRLDRAAVMESAWELFTLPATPGRWTGAVCFEKQEVPAFVFPPNGESCSSNSLAIWCGIQAKRYFISLKAARLVLTL